MIAGSSLYGVMLAENISEAPLFGKAVIISKATPFAKANIIEKTDCFRNRVFLSSGYEKDGFAFLFNGFELLQNQITICPHSGHLASS